MFDQQDYYSEEDDNLQHSMHIPTGKVLLPNSGSQFNHLTGQGESLLKMMKDRGLDFNDQELKKLKANNTNRQKEPLKPKPKAGFLDGGASASYEQLLKSLNKALAQADPQQASVVLSHLLERKNLSQEDRNKFGIMKCKILFGLGAYQDCEAKAAALLEKGSDNHLVAASLSNYLAKSRAELDKILDSYMDFLRAKAHLEKQRVLSPPIEINQVDEFADSEMDTVARQIEHTEMELNIRMNRYKNATNLVHPYFPEFRHRKILHVVCGDFHSLFLVGGAIGGPDTCTEVFGMGENSVGQILGRSSMEMFKQPTLIVELSGKNICGLAANRESSCAWDSEGRIYQWGIKQKRDEQISITYKLDEPIKQFQKGYQHYAALTVSGKLYTWGTILCKGAGLRKQQKPSVQPGQNITNISCGNNHVSVVDKYGDMFVLGSNQYGQLGLEGQNHAKTFKKLNNVWLGPVRKVICIADTTFIINRDQELFFCGKISHNKQNIEKPRQGQYTGDVEYVTSISGTIGNYYLTSARGELYHWDVDSSVKFKLNKENQKISQRIVQSSRGHVLRIRSLFVPELTKVKQITNDPCSYEDIQFSVQLFDQHGPYCCPNFVLPPRCQIFLSTYAIKADQLLKQNKLFLESYQCSSDDSKVLLNQIVESRIIRMKIERNQEDPSCHRLTFLTQQSGKFYFYVIMEEKIVYSHQLKISVSERQQELSEKNKREKQMRQEERHRKAQIQRQRLLEEKLRKQAEQQEKRKQTQKRAQQAFKKHMREQEELKSKAEEQRKARKELQTGGGFDLSKLKAKNEKLAAEKYTSEKQQLYRAPDLIQKNSDPLMKSGESFLPDINARPGSKRKINMPSKNSLTMTSYDSVRGDRPASRKEQLGGTGNLFKSESIKQKEVKPVTTSQKSVEGLAKTSTGGRVIVKRGLSKGKK